MVNNHYTRTIGMNSPTTIAYFCLLELVCCDGFATLGFGYLVTPFYHRQGEIYDVTASKVGEITKIMRRLKPLRKQRIYYVTYRKYVANKGI